MTKRERNYHEKNRTLRTFKALLGVVQRRINARLYGAAVEAVYYGGSAVDRLPHVPITGPEVILVGADTMRAVSALEGIRTAIRIAPPPAQNRTFVSADIYEAIQKRPTIVEEAIKETARRIVDGTDPNT